MRPLTGAVADMHGTGLAMVVPMMFFVAAWTYALAVNFWPWYRDTADSFTTTVIGTAGTCDEEFVGIVRGGEKMWDVEHNEQLGTAPEVSGKQ